MKRTRLVIAGTACFAMLAAGAQLAQAQSGGTPPPGSTYPPPTTTEPAPGSWTVYKKATWYGPGFWGRSTACGIVLGKKVLGTAHKNLPCGTQVTFSHAGRSVTATVIDRGPYRKGYAWDLTKKTAKKVGFLEVGSGPIQATVTPPAAPTY